MPVIREQPSRQPANLLANLAIYLSLKQASLHGTSIEVCLRANCSVWAHTDCLNKSGSRDTVVCQCVCDTVCLQICLLTENFWGL